MPTQEEVVLIQQEAEKKENKPRMCVISREGVTLFGFHLSWVVIVLIAVLVLVYLNKTGMLGDSVSSILGSEEAPRMMGPSMDKGALNSMSGGFKSFNIGGRGEMRMKMNL